MTPCSLGGADCTVCARESNQIEMLIVASPETKETCTLAIDHFNAVHPANAKSNG